MEARAWFPHRSLLCRAGQIQGLVGLLQNCLLIKKALLVGEQAHALQSRFDYTLIRFYGSNDKFSDVLS